MKSFEEKKIEKQLFCRAKDDGKVSSGIKLEKHFCTSWYFKVNANRI
ncbi:hypothetical protein ACT7C2_26515 [Bacillus pacificus]